MTMRRLIGSLAAAVVFALPTLAHAVTVQTLNMGKDAEVWFVPDHTVPVISLTAAIPAGSAYDPENKHGLATFAASMIDEGAGPYNSAGFQAALSGRAIRFSATPGRDYMIVSLLTLKENAKDAFRLLGTALSKPHFDPDAISRVRVQILASLQEEDEDPSSVAAKAFFRTFFAGHPYGHSAEGDPTGIAAITREDLKNFAQNHWVRGGVHIAVSGDIDAATLKTLLATAFSALPDRTPPPIAPIAHLGTPGMQVVAMPVPQPNIVFGLPGLMRNDPDFVPGYVANYILGGGGFASRLTSEVREKRGLTYSIATSLNTYRRAGIVAGQVATKAGSVRQTIAVIRDTLAEFAANGPTDKELTDAKTYLTGSFPLAFASNVGISGQLNAFQNAGLAVNYVQKRNDMINAVTADDVKRVAKRLFNANKLTIVVAGALEGPKEAAKPLPGPDKPPQPAPPLKPGKNNKPFASPDRPKAPASVTGRGMPRR
jgi:zinc protease